MQISLKEAKKHITSCLRAKLPVMLHSSPGIGKSSILKQIAKDSKLVFIDVRLSTLDPIVLSGYPTEGDNFATFKPFDLFPTESTPVPAGMNGFLLCFEELPDSPKLIQSAAYRILLDREIGNHKIHSKCYMVAAGNLASDGAASKKMSTALQSRMAHLEIGINVPDWIEYANKAQINTMITSFIQWKGAMLYNFDPKHSDMTFACPRTWCFLSPVLADSSKVKSQRPLIDGIVGKAASNEFIAFTQFYSQIPTIKSILADPKGVEIPMGGIAYALTGVIAEAMSKHTVEDLMKYIVRMPMELQVVALRRTLSSSPELALFDVIDDWASVNSARLM